MPSVADNNLTTGSAQAGGLGAISPTVAIDVLGTFIAKRFREEINAAYIDRFRLTLLRPDSLHLLVPETYKVLRYSDPYNYTSFLQTLQESFDDDLRHLPFNTNQYMARNRNKMVELMRSPVLFDLTASALHVVSEIQDDKDGLVILSEIGNAPTTVNTADNKLKSAIRLTSVLSRNVSLTGTVAQGGLSALTKTEWGNLRRDPQLRNLFIGLMIERERQTLNDIRVPSTTGAAGATITLYEWMITNQGKASQILRSADTISVAINNLKTIKAALNLDKKNAGSENRKPETVGFTFSLIEGSLDAVITGINLTEIIIPSATGTTQLPQLRKDINTTRRLLPSVRYVFEKRYGMALSGVITYLRELMPRIDDRSSIISDSTLAKKLVKANKFYQKAAKQLVAIPGLSTAQSSALSAQITRFNSLTATIETLRKTPTVGKWVAGDTSLQRCALRNTLMEKTGELMKYGSFMVTVVQSKTKDEMLQALETAALPVGSYRIKRNNWFSVSVNSYGGIYGGRQFAANGDKTLIAPSAPIGAYVGWGKEQALVNTQKNKESTGNDGQSNGIFVSLLDVGAVAAFRLDTQNQTTQLPELTWKNVLAPGVYYVHGLKNVLSLGVGIQYGPELSQIKGAETPGFNPQAFRIGVKLTADIPIFNLYTKASRGATDKCKCR